MKQRILPLLLSIALVFAGCSSTEETVVERNPESATETVTETVVSEESAETLVDEKLFSVDVTIPASFYQEEGEEMTQEKVDEIVATSNFKSGVLNDDGSVTYTMSKNQHAEFLQTLKDSIQESVDGLINGDNAIESFTKITFNENLSEFDVYVDSAKYSAFDSLSALAFYIAGQYYQLFDGIAYDDTEVVVNFINKDTEDVIDSGSLSQMRANLTSETVEASETSESDSSVSTENTNVATIDEQALLDQDGIKITATGFEYDGSFLGHELTLLIENNSEQDITVQARNVSVNGYMVDSSMSADVAAGKKANDALTFTKTSLENSGIEQIADMEFFFHIYDSDEWDVILDTETISLQTSIANSFTQTYDDSGELLYEDDKVKIVLKDFYEDSFLGSALRFYIENNSDENITIQVRDTSVNGFMMDPSMSTEIAAGKKAIGSMTFFSSEIEKNKIESFDTVETAFHIYNTDTWDTVIDTAPITMDIK